MKTTNLAALATAALTLSLACHYEPATPELSFSLNYDYMEAQNPDLLADDAALARLEGGLEFLVGNPQAPNYLVLPEWADDEFDPNFWGVDSLSEADYDELVASNRAQYRLQLEAIAAGDFDGLPYTRYADDLWSDWLLLRDDMPEDPDSEYGEGTWREEAVYLFENYYPTLQASSELYRQQCFHCHGAEGGGDGSTAPFLNPIPRDYRLGIFKFTAVGKNRPRHSDLVRILEEGIYTTAMPSFRRFSDAQISGLVDYVRLLAIRGETEVLMVGDFDPDEGMHFDNLKENYELVVDRWREASETLIAYEGEVPTSTPERVAHGKALFLSETGANCVKCHGPGGRGDGPSVSEPENSIDDWGNEIKPRDLTRGLYHFGRRPIDLYRRIYAGINGTPMPEHYGMQITEEDGDSRPLNEDDVWDLVFFVQSLSVVEPAPAAPAPETEEGHGL